MLTTTERSTSSLRVERRGDSSVLAEIESAAPLRLRPLPARGAVARIAISQSEATILAGDSFELNVRVGEGASVEIVEVGALLAHHAREGAEAGYGTRLLLEPDSRLAVIGEPLIVASGARLRRRTSVELAGSAACLLAETVVLGRSGEAPGELAQRTRALLAGEPLLDDALDTGPNLSSRLVAGPATKVITTLSLLGIRDRGSSRPPGTMELAGPGALARFLEPTGAAATGSSSALLERWRRLLFDERGGNRSSRDLVT